MYEPSPEFKDALIAETRRVDRALSDALTAVADLTAKQKALGACLRAYKLEGEL